MPPNIEALSKFQNIAHQKKISEFVMSLLESYKTKKTSSIFKAEASPRNFHKTWGTLPGPSEKVIQLWIPSVQVSSFALTPVCLPPSCSLYLPHWKRSFRIGDSGSGSYAWPFCYWPNQRKPCIWAKRRRDVCIQSSLLGNGPFVSNHHLPVCRLANTFHRSRGQGAQRGNAGHTPTCHFSLPQNVGVFAWSFALRPGPQWEASVSSKVTGVWSGSFKGPALSDCL